MKVSLPSTNRHCFHLTPESHYSKNGVLDNVTFSNDVYIPFLLLYIYILNFAMFFPCFFSLSSSCYLRLASIKISVYCTTKARKPKTLEEVT